MKLRYDKEDDVMMIWFSKKPVDFAEQAKNVVAHFSKKNELVLIEILDASKFLKEESKILPSEIKEKYFATMATS